MKYLHMIPCVNRPDLLEKSLASIHALWHYTFILDNSFHKLISQFKKWPVEVIVPEEPLSCPESLNFLHKTAKERGCDLFGWNHNDVYAHPNEDVHWLNFLRGFYRTEKKWGVVFTDSRQQHLYPDQMAAFNPVAIDAVGGWCCDYAAPNSHFDDELYYRFKLGGFELVQSGIQVTHDVAQTIASDAERRRAHNVKISENESYYQAKWGGQKTHERFTTPWGR